MNGAGKTSTIEMLMGAEKISDGEAFVCGVDVKKEFSKVKKFIGYCPQFDTLLNDLTPSETMEMFALLRGVPRKQIAELKTKFAIDLDLEEHINKKVRDLSGGNKRKLSVAIALIGNPKLVFLGMEF